MTTEKIESTVEAWEDRLLGADEAFVNVAKDVNQTSIDEALGLKMISIRLEQSLIDDFKAIATLNNMGYQTLMRQALKRFTEGEKKFIASEMEARRVAEAETLKAAVSGAKSEKSSSHKAKKAA